MNLERWIPIIDADLCIGCGDCVEVCPTEALALRERSAAGEFPGREEPLAYVADPEACSYCAYCEPICPTAAVELPYLLIWEDQ